MPTRDKRLRMEANKRRREAEADEGALPAAATAAPPASDPITEEWPMAVHATSPIYWVRFTVPGVGFFTYHGTNYDRGQLMPLVGGPRDEQLVRMGYVQPASSDEAHLQAQCGVCERWFLNEQFRDAHGRLRHSDRFRQEDLDIGGGMEGPDGGTAFRDITGDADERRMQQQYPLYLDKTRATIESSPA